MTHKEAMALYAHLKNEMPAPDALLEAARIYLDETGVILPAHGAWNQARTLLGSLSDGDVAVANAAFRLWQTSRGASGRLLDDDSRISVTDAAERAGMTRTYIKEEIKRGNLPATMNVTGGYEIAVRDFQAWMSNPRRGSRTGRAGG